MIEATCHCGAIDLAIDHAPDEVTDCNCSICHRYGVLWAYYSPSQVRQTTGIGETEAYLWGERSIAFHHCRTCGCVIHWASVDAGRERMGINANLLAVEVLARARVRHLDGADTWKSSYR